MAEVIKDHQDLDREVTALREQGLDVRYAVEYGHPDEGIAEEAALQHADLIVMAPHHRRRLESLRHPSVTARMFSRAPAPILVWPDASPGRAFSNFLNVAGSAIVVPLDGSDVAERALPFATAFAREYSRPILLLRIVAPVVMSGSPGAGAEAYWMEVTSQSDLEHEARCYLRSVRERLHEAGCASVYSMALRGVPAAEILRAAETHNGSLVVMSTHGRSGLTHMLMGSVATEVMRRTPLPLLVVPPHAAMPTHFPLESAIEEPPIGPDDATAR
jgi:nucleotide-binding universal stress UspA family protein